MTSAPGTPRARWRLEVIVPLALVTVAVAIPAALIVAAAFNTGDPRDFPGHEFGLANFAELSGHLDWIGNTLLVAVGGTAFAMVLATALSWILHRTHTPGARIFETLVILPYPLGPLVGALAWNALAAPRVGLLNQAISSVTGLPSSFIDVWTLPGIACIMGLYEAPAAILIIGAAMQRMDPALEECSAVHGGTPLVTAFRITLPLMMPALVNAALLVFVSILGAFAIPAILGAGARIYLMSVAIYVSIQSYPPDNALAATLTLALVAITLLAVLLGRYLLKGRSFVVVTGKNYRPRRLSLGRWTWVPLFILSAYVLLAVVLPLGTLILSSLQPNAMISWSPGNWTLANYHYVVLDFPTTRYAILNSLIVGVASATIGVIFATIVSWIVFRSQSAGRPLLEAVMTLPQAIPHFAFGVGLAWMVLLLPIDIYGTLYAVLLGHLIIFLPLGYRSMAGVIRQIDPALEEAGRVSGSSWSRVMRTITFPLVRSGLAAAWALLFMVSIREASTSVLLTGPNSPVLGPAILSFWNSGGLPQVSALVIVQATIILLVLGAMRIFVGRRLATS